jgi:O-antigen/teichoic acid export membrane protein
MTQFDRLVIGAMVSLSAVSYYVTPYEAVTKMWIVAGAVGSVVFPHFSREGEPGALRGTFARALLLIGGALAPFVAVLLVWGRGLLSLWITPEFAVHATPVAKILAVAILVNALAFVPFSLIQGRGRPDVTAKYHMLELPLYLVSLVALIRMYGITGAAIAYAVRVAIDALLLFGYARRFLRSAPAHSG